MGLKSFSQHQSFLITVEGLNFLIFLLCFLITWQHLEIIKINREEENPESLATTASNHEFFLFLL